MRTCCRAFSATASERTRRAGFSGGHPCVSARFSRRPSSIRWRFSRENYQFVVIDAPPGLTEDTCAAIRQSDRLAIVITPELPAIRNAIRSIEYLTSLHYPEDSIDIVLNRYSKRSTLSDHEIEAALHRRDCHKDPQ